MLIFNHKYNKKESRKIIRRRKDAESYIKQENQITVISGTIALFGHFVLKSEEIVLPSLVTASVLGIAPIAIQTPGIE